MAIGPIGESSCHYCYC